MSATASILPRSHDHIAGRTRQMQATIEPGLTGGTQARRELPKVSCCLWFPAMGGPRDAVQLTELEPEAWYGLAGWASGRAAELPALSRLLSAALPVWVLPANLPTLTAECARVNWDTLTEPALGGFSVLSLVISQAAGQSGAGLRFTPEGGALSRTATTPATLPAGLQNGLLKDALVMLALPPEEQQRLNCPGCLTCDLYEDFQAAWRAAQHDASLGFTPEQRSTLQALSQSLDALAPEDCDCLSPGAVRGPGWQAIRQQAAAALPCFGWQHATVRPFTQTSPGVWTRPSETENAP